GFEDVFRAYKKVKCTRATIGRAYIRMGVQRPDNSPDSLIQDAFTLLYQLFQKSLLERVKRFKARFVVFPNWEQCVFSHP
ncbi:MAG: hypothetical protein QF519_04770, partial [Candidatus Poseidoniia archaeon]|nr:hypothetical protein [Candidatus Poseidoniia archaeon]